MESNELRHYGVLGMKWGRRRASDSSSRVSKIQAGKNAKAAAKTARKESIANDRASGLSGIGSFRRADLNAKAAMKDARRASLRNDSAHNKQLRQEKKAEKQEKKTKKNEVTSMSDDDLRKRINRLQMEKQYKQLTANESGVGRKFVTDVLTNSAKETAKNYVSKYMTKGIDLAVNAAIKQIKNANNKRWVM